MEYKDGIEDDLTITLGPPRYAADVSQEFLKELTAISEKISKLVGEDQSSIYTYMEIRKMKLLLTKRDRKLRIDQSIFANFDIIDCFFHLIEFGHPNIAEEVLSILKAIIQQREIEGLIEFLNAHEFGRIFLLLIGCRGSTITSLCIDLLTEILDATNETKEYVLGIISPGDIATIVAEMQNTIAQESGNSKKFDIDALVAFGHYIYKLAIVIDNSQIPFIQELIVLASDFAYNFQDSYDIGLFIWAMVKLFELNPAQLIDIYNQKVNIVFLCNCCNSPESLARSGSLLLLLDGFQNGCDMEKVDFNCLFDRFKNGGDPDLATFANATKCLKIFLTKYKDSLDNAAIETLFELLSQIDKDQISDIHALIVSIIMEIIHQYDESCMFFVENLNFFKWFERATLMDSAKIILSALKALHKIFFLAARENYLELCIDIFQKNDLPDQLDTLAEIFSENEEIQQEMESILSQFFEV